MQKIRRPTKDFSNYSYRITDKGIVAIKNQKESKELLHFLEEIENENDTPWKADWSLLRTDPEELGMSVETILDKALNKDYIRIFCTPRYDYYNDNDKRKYFVAVGQEHGLLLVIRAESITDAKSKIIKWIIKNWRVWRLNGIFSGKLNDENVKLVFSFLFKVFRKITIHEISAEAYNETLIEMETKTVTMSMLANEDKELDIMLPL